MQDANKPLVQVDLSTAAGQQQAQQLLSCSMEDSSLGSSTGSMLLQLLTGGTLVLSNVHKVRNH
jgi:hypothetical protein